MHSVLIKLQGAGLFGQVELHPEDTVARLVDRACAKFSRGWDADATQLALHLVAPGGLQQEPPEAAILAALATARLGVGLPLALAGVTPGAWLVARRVQAGATAAAAPAPDPVHLLASYHLEPLDECQRDALRHHDAFAGVRAQLAAGAFASRFLPPLLRRLAWWALPRACA
jgi:hypothetical protein